MPELTAGEVAAQLSFANGAGYTLTRTAGGWNLRFHSVGDFDLSEDLTDLRINLLPDGRKDLVPLLLAGQATALIEGLRGRAVLHASAVEHASRGIAVIGNSGRGKSTTAALCCIDGARLITDDILCLERRTDGYDCLRGATSLRLRDHNASLAAAFGGARIERTADDRLALSVATVGDRPVPLSAVVLPEPARDCDRVEVERLKEVDALHALAAYARITGWCAREYVSRQFAHFADVARRVPVYRARLPWGPPFRPGIGLELMECLPLS